MENIKNLELELVKRDGTKINPPNDYLDLSAELGYNTRLNTLDRFHPNHLDMVIEEFKGDIEDEAHLINKIYDLGYKLYEGDKNEK